MAVKVQAVIAAWKSFELHSVQRELDETASELATRQDESEHSRKKLVESPGSSRRTPQRMYEICGDCILNVYKKVIDISDPLPTLEYCVGLEKKIGRLADLEIENKNLRETLREYNEEFKEVRNQDVTIKALKEKIKNYEDLMDNNVQTKIKEMERELSRQYAEKERLLEETQESVMRRLQDAESRAQTLQSTLDQTQSELFELKSKSEESNFARSDEINILLNDLERANQRATIAERESAQLKEQLQKTLARSSLEIELASKDKEISQLVEDIKQLQNSLNLLRESSSSQIRALEENQESNTHTIATLEAKVQQQRDYDEIKRELSIMKSVEFSSISKDGGEESSFESSSKPLEVLLLEKTKTLSSLYRGEGEGSSVPEIVAEAVRASTSSTPPLGTPQSSRERFRQRNEELEAELTGKSQQVVLLQNELDNLRADNLKLYEKIRFLQSYQGRQSSEDSAAESRYSSQYEEALDPFSSFSQSCKRDFASDCAQKFAEHMNQVHGHSDFHDFNQ
nr:protein CASP-like [Penaeus vannamei]